MFGEIDCREGLTMAVDKLKYETVDAAMDVLLHIYKGDATLCGDAEFHVLPCVIDSSFFGSGSFNLGPSSGCVLRECLFGRCCAPCKYYMLVPIQGNCTTVLV